MVLCGRFSVARCEFKRMSIEDTTEHRNTRLCAKAKTQAIQKEGAEILFLNRTLELAWYQIKKGGSGRCIAEFEINQRYLKCTIAKF
jgi:hypothetical protein